MREIQWMGEEIDCLNCCSICFRCCWDAVASEVVVNAKAVVVVDVKTAAAVAAPSKAVVVVASESVIVAAAVAAVSEGVAATTGLVQ